MRGMLGRAIVTWLLVLALAPAIAGAAQTPTDVRWVIVQFQPERDQQANVTSIEMAIELAGSIGADLVLLPELATTMYPWGAGGDVMSYYAAAAEPVPGGATCERFAALAAQYEMYVGWGMAESDGAGGIYNSFVLMGPDGSHVGTYRKVHLVPGIETAVFRAGSAAELLSTSFGRIGVLICFDRRFPELARTYALQGADLLVVASATTDRTVDEFILPARAYENDLWLLFANQVGPHPQPGSGPMHGDSRVIDPLGATRGRASADSVELLVVDVSSRDLSLGSGILDWRRPEVYVPQPADLENVMEETEETLNGRDSEPGVDDTGAVTLDDAIAMARQITTNAVTIPTATGGETPVLYVLSHVVAAGQRIESWTETVFEATADTWFVFIDLEPSANWEHPAQYLFVAAATGEATVVSSTVPPRNLSEMLIVTDEEPGG